MKALIIGGAGFVGNYLLQHLESEYDWALSVTKMPAETMDIDFADVYDLDILDKSAIVHLLNEVKPDYIFHLAAQSSVGLSWKKPVLTVDVNINGCINLLDAVRELDYNPRILLIGSGEEYGRIKPCETPIKEDNKTRPGNIYAATKACQNMIGHIYASAYDMDIIMVRAFNHIGPNQAPLFVVADFCKQVAQIENNLKEPVIKVGNLSAMRDFTDVRDVVRAYPLLIQQGVSGETYNIGSGKAYSIEDILKLILSFSTTSIRIEIDPQKLRPVDIPIIEADVHKLTDCINWTNTISLEKSLEETLNYWRNNILSD